MRRFLMVLGIVILIPYLTTLAWTGKLETGGVGSGETNGTGNFWSGNFYGNAQTGSERSVVVMRNGVERTISVEEFLVHVLASQISAEFGPETLKAQAILARTYVYGIMDGRKTIYEEELDMDALSVEQMKGLWGEAEFAKLYAKLQTAVSSTAGLYLLYEGALIEPFFCYASAGTTRSRGEEYPYLKQTDSSMDMQAEGYRSLPVFSESEFCKRVNEIPGAIPVSPEQIPEEIQIVERDSAGYVLQVQIGQKTYTGEEVQYALGLASACYSFESLDEKIRVICKGIGHGYGFSQFGANEVEKNGMGYKELLHYYFQNVEIIGI